MDESNSPPITNFIPAALILMLAGWGGLAALVIYTLPTIGPLWLFFFLAVLAFTGTALPVMAFLNQRFPSAPPASHGTILRQALWVGTYVSTLAWLQIGRVLTVAMALLLAIGLFLIELLMRMRERSQWKPNE